MPENLTDRVGLQELSRVADLSAFGIAKRGQNHGAPKHLVNRAGCQREKDGVRARLVIVLSSNLALLIAQMFKFSSKTP